VQIHWTGYGFHADEKCAGVRGVVGREWGTGDVRCLSGG
jgi:hypothetical protein